MWILGITSWASSTPFPNGRFCPMASSNGVFARVEYEKSALRSSSVMLAASHNGCRTLPLQKRRFPCPRHKIAPFGNGVLSRGRCGGRHSPFRAATVTTFPQRLTRKGGPFVFVRGADGVLARGRSGGSRGRPWSLSGSHVRPWRGNAPRRALALSRGCRPAGAGVGMLMRRKWRACCACTGSRTQGAIPHVGDSDTGGRSGGVGGGGRAVFALGRRVLRPATGAPGARRDGRWCAVPRAA